MCRITASTKLRSAFHLLLLVGLLAGCSAPRVESPPGPLPMAAAPGPAHVPRDATVYVVDSGRSVVTLRVRRAGPLAMLGHNHVITSSVESGRAWTTGELSASGFEVRLPVAGLVVDDPAARATAGPDFAAPVPQDTRDGTRRNLLRPEVLDAERHPEIVVAADSLRGSWERPEVTAQVTLKGRTLPVDVPLVIVREPQQLVARGSFRVLQSDFGITPFSVGGGAIQVADAVDVEFEIVAVR